MRPSRGHSTEWLHTQFAHLRIQSILLPFERRSCFAFIWTACQMHWDFVVYANGPVFCRLSEVTSKIKSNSAAWKETALQEFLCPSSFRPRHLDVSCFHCLNINWQESEQEQLFLLSFLFCFFLMCSQTQVLWRRHDILDVLCVCLDFVIFPFLFPFSLIGVDRTKSWSDFDCLVEHSTLVQDTSEQTVWLLHLQCSFCLHTCRTDGVWRPVQIGCREIRLFQTANVFLLSFTNVDGPVLRLRLSQIVTETAVF